MEQFSIGFSSVISKYKTKMDTYNAANLNPGAFSSGVDVSPAPKSSQSASTGLVNSGNTVNSNYTGSPRISSQKRVENDPPPPSIPANKKAFEVMNARQLNLLAPPPIHKLNSIWNANPEEISFQDLHELFSPCCDRQKTGVLLQSQINLPLIDFQSVLQNSPSSSNQQDNENSTSKTRPHVSLLDSPNPFDHTSHHSSSLLPPERSSSPISFSSQTHKPQSAAFDSNDGLMWGNVPHSSTYSSPSLVSMIDSSSSVSKASTSTATGTGTLPLSTPAPSKNATDPDYFKDFMVSRNSGSFTGSGPKLSTGPGSSSATTSPYGSALTNSAPPPDTSFSFGEFQSSSLLDDNKNNLLSDAPVFIGISDTSSTSAPSLLRTSQQNANNNNNNNIPPQHANSFAPWNFLSSDNQTNSQQQVNPSFQPLGGQLPLQPTQANTSPSLTSSVLFPDTPSIIHSTIQSNAPPTISFSTSNQGVPPLPSRDLKQPFAFDKLPMHYSASGVSPRRP